MLAQFAFNIGQGVRYRRLEQATCGAVAIDGSTDKVVGARIAHVEGDVGNQFADVDKTGFGRRGGA